MKTDKYTYKAGIPQCKVMNCDDTAPAAPVNSYDPATRYSFQNLNDSPSGTPRAGKVSHRAFKADDDAPKSW